MNRRVRFWLVIFALAAVNGAPAPGFAQTEQLTTLQIQVKDALQTCYQCHGPGGVSVIPSRPTIAGQKAEYVRRQLAAFRMAADAAHQGQGDDAKGEERAVADIPKRTDPVMEHMAAGLPEHLIKPVADAVASLPCDGGTPKPPAVKVPVRPKAANACVICHGHDGIGVQPHIPNLAGQHRSYLRRQLLLIRETAWGAQPREGEAWRTHPIMEAEVARIKIVDVDAIARYYSTLNCRGEGAQSKTDAQQ